MAIFEEEKNESKFDGIQKNLKKLQGESIGNETGAKFIDTVVMKNRVKVSQW